MTNPRWYTAKPRGSDGVRRKRNLTLVLDALNDFVDKHVDDLIYKMAFTSGMDVQTIQSYIKIIVYSGETPFTVNSNGFIKKGIEPAKAKEKKNG